MSGLTLVLYGSHTARVGAASNGLYSLQVLMTQVTQFSTKKLIFIRLREIDISHRYTSQLVERTPMQRRWQKTHNQHTHHPSAHVL